MIGSALALALLAVGSTALPNPMPKAMPKAMPMAFPDPLARAQSERKALTSTDLCLEGAFEEFQFRLGGCRTTAQAIVDEGSTDFANFNNYLCQSIEEEMACFDTIGPDCLDDELLDINKYNFLRRMFQTAYNNTFLGESFIDSCPAMVEQEDFVASTWADGPTGCRYFEIEESTESYNKCRKSANGKVEFAIQLTQAGLLQDPRAILVQAECTYIQEFKGCATGFARCFSSTVLTEFWKKVDTEFEEREDLVDNALRGFSYDQCPQAFEEDEEEVIRTQSR